MTDSLLIALGVTGVLSVLLYVWTAIGLAAVFRKAGEDAWKAWVPFLNGAVVLQLGGFSGWLVLIVLVPLFGPLLLYVSAIVATHNINRSFGLGGGMTVLAALLFPVWASVLGFGSARWLATEEGWGPVRSSPTVALPFGPLDVPERTSSLLDGPRPYSGDGLRISPLPDEGGRRRAPEPEPAPSPHELWFGTEDAEEPEAAPSEEPFPSTTGWIPPAPPPAAPAPPAVPPTTAIPSVRPEPAPEQPSVTRRSWGDFAVTEDDAFPEASGAVSAVVGAPRAGAPRSALSSVSAQHTRPDDDLPDETVVTRRRRVTWALVPAGAAPIELTGERAILGRRPAADPLHPGAQLVAIPDPTRTVSKTHALLRRRGETWFITDLGSTNGVVFATIMGAEVEAEPGVEVEAGERFLLGDLEVRVTRTA
jgi:hypothetical protein